MAERAGWGAYVTGELIDLADWEHRLKAPFTPWLERSEADVVLRSAAFDTLQDPREVADRATALIDLLNGALAVSEGTRPITFGGVVEFRSDGTRTRVVFPVSAYVELRGVKARGVAGNLGPAPPPTASEAQVWAEVSDREPLLADALVYYGRRTDWFDIYKALECLEKKFGGETSLRNRLWMPLPALEKLKQTANSFRHARLKFEPVADPMPLDEARRVLGQLIRCAFEEMSGRSHG